MGRRQPFVQGKKRSVPSYSMCSPATSALMTRIASSVCAIVIGGLPSTRRAESPRPMPRSIRPFENSSRTAMLEAVTDGSRVPGLVTHVPSRSVDVSPAISVRSGYGSRHRTCESKSQPLLKPAPSARRVSSSVRSIVCSGLSVNPKSIGRLRSRAREVREPTRRAFGPRAPSRRRARESRWLGHPPPGGRAGRAHTRCRQTLVRNGPEKRVGADSGRDEVVVRVGSAVAVELPDLADLRDDVEIEVADDQLFLERAADTADELAAGVDEVALAVEVVVAELLLDPDPVDRADVVAVRDRV